MKLLLAGILYYTIKLVSGNLEVLYKKEEVIPDCLDEAPQNLLQLKYDDKLLQFGDELTPTEVKNAPDVELYLDPSSYYVLIKNDLDAPSRQNKKFSEWLHWLVVNIPGDNFTKGETIAEYASAGPPKDTGLHRYVFTLYKQPDGKMVYDEKPVSRLALDGRLRFSLRKFVEKYNLGVPIAGNMYQAQYDDYVALLHKELSINLDEF